MIFVPECIKMAFIGLRIIVVAVAAVDASARGERNIVILGPNLERFFNFWRNVVRRDVVMSGGRIVTQGLALDA